MFINLAEFYSTLPLPLSLPSRRQTSHKLIEKRSKFEIKSEENQQKWSRLESDWSQSASQVSYMIN